MIIDQKPTGSEEASQLYSLAKEPLGRGKGTCKSEEEMAASLRGWRGKHGWRNE